MLKITGLGECEYEKENQTQEMMIRDVFLCLIVALVNGRAERTSG
jgi:hypothetical protein